MTAAKFQPNTFPTSVSEVTQPVAGATMHKEYVKTIGRMAYVWGWPMVNMFNRRAGITQAPEPGRLGAWCPWRRVDVSACSTTTSCRSRAL
jgi:hypothetical protein